MADHAGAAADIALGHRAVLRRRQRREDMRLGDVKRVDVAQPAVIGLGDHGKMEGLRCAVANRKRGNGVTNDADLIGVGDPDRRAKQALLGEPGQPGHLAVAIE